MKTIILRSLPPTLVIAVALALDAAGVPGGALLLTFGILFGLYPLVAKVVSEFRKNRRVDLGLPVVITICILVFLGDLKTAGVFVLLILAGGFFKDYIIWRVQKSVESLSEALPNTALRKAGTDTVEVKIVDLRKGEVVVLKPGSRVPVDGKLLMDHASFDESVVTGESRPVAKRAGDRLVAGAINLSDYAEMEATETSANSTIAQVKRLVQEAQARAAPLSKFTDRYAQWTVIVTLVLCVALFAATHDVVRTLALWIALVPVVFAIIVPVSTTLGISILAKRGILIKNAEAVENLTKIDVITFDKTGTLTKGSPEVVDIATLPGFERRTLLQAVASVEKFSEHHLGAAIVRKAVEEGIGLAEVREPKTVKGKGIAAVCDGAEVRVGNRLFIAESGIAIPDDVGALARRNEETGSSAVFAAVGGRLAGVFFIADALRENARAVVARLRKMGFTVVMLTGDSRSVAVKIAGELGIDDVRAECLPQDKIAHLVALKKGGRKVAMVGDGINDAPALAEANVGIAMGLRGADITLESAQAVLIHDDLSILPDVVRSSRRIFATIKGDLFIATAIHVVTAGLVVAGILGILGSTLLHQVSSMAVLFNTLRLFGLGGTGKGQGAEK